MEPLIRLVDIEKSFAHGPGRTFVLRRISLDIQEGDFVSIMGPSGAGKSTLLHILGMHDSAFAGEYHLMGEPVHALSCIPMMCRSVDLPAPDGPMIETNSPSLMSALIRRST